MLKAASYFIVAAAVFDFFDGFAARALGAYSAIGKELDSLADAISFGVAPACVAHVMMLSAAKQYGLSVEVFAAGWWIATFAFVIAAFSALRLAKFNIDTRQSDSFIGLPTPANALFFCSLAFISAENRAWAPLVENLFFLLATTSVFSYLLVAELRLFSLKFKSFDWKSNKTRYVFVISCAVILSIFKGAGFAAAILIYITISILTNILCNKSISGS